MRKIVVIGGGISGLATLYYLKQKYASRDDVRVLLLEKNAGLGGTIHSIIRGNYLFETGPNGFLDSKPRTLELISELDLTNELIKAGAAAQRRYVALQNNLYAFPENPRSFFAFKPFNLVDKLRVPAEVFIPKGRDPDESIYAFGARRFGKKFAEIFLDPMVGGIYGGDAREIVLRAAFGRIYELEQQYGSLFKAMLKLKKGGMPKGTLTSFRRGQAQLIDTLAQRYSKDIHSDCEVRGLGYTAGHFRVEAADGHHQAQEVFMCVPAYAAAVMLKDMSPAMTAALDKIHYAPMAVVGLVFPLQAFASPPEGFGYLIPSSEGKQVLGVLFESNIFQHRCPKGQDQILMRVMVGGARYPDISFKSREALTALAVEEVQTTLKTGVQPVETFFAQWPKAIPQYDRAYVEAERGLEEELKKWQGFYLVANYRKGVSLNDCIENAYQAARSSVL